MQAHIGFSAYYLQTHIHIIPRKASDCLWTSEVCAALFMLLLCKAKEACEYDTNNCFKFWQSLRRRPLNFNQDASRLVDRVREELSMSNVSEESKAQEPTLS